MKPNPPTRYSEPIEGIEDWYEVTAFGHYDYSWSEMMAWYSPSARQYFWISGSGCSCYSLSEEFESIASFENGSRDDLIRAIKRYAKDDGRYYSDLTPSYVLEVIEGVKRFKEPANV